MRLVSYNIRKAVGLDWRRDPARIVDVLAEIDADIVVLQEADRRFGSKEGVLPLDRLELDLGLTNCDLSIRPQSQGWHGNAVFAKQHLSDRRAARIALPSIDPRGAVAVHFVQPNVEIVGVHLGLTPGMRRKQMEVLNDVLKNRPHPVLLAGDFNEWRKKRLRFRDADAIENPGHSFHTARPIYALDLFVLSRGVKAISSHVHRSPLANRASDHLPVVIDFAVTGRAQ
ncbi:MAG: endonuclease/exonuclease/phosphatase family protein [Pseudomonadota bacterium]